MEPDDRSDWRVETLRLTVFPTAIPDISNIEWWKTVVGLQPETKNLQPRAGRLREFGPIKDGLCTLSLECQPERIDWLFFPILEGQDNLTEWPTFVDLPDGVQLFREFLFPWLRHSPPANRLAFGAVLTRSVANRKIAYELLGKYLPAVSLDPENSRDFAYQINRPRPSASGIPGLEVNRLSRWIAAQLSEMRIQLSPGEPTRIRLLESGSTRHACRLELDINTSPQFEGTLPSEKLAGLLQELVDLGREIAALGDIP